MVLLALAGCATSPSNCRSGEQALVSDQLYFGTDIPGGGGRVSAEAWNGFVHEVVSPRFPQGLSVWGAAGHWRGNDGVIVREDSFVLSLVHADDDASERAVQAIVAEYKQRYRQEAVLRVRAPSCASF